MGEAGATQNNYPESHSGYKNFVFTPEHAVAIPHFVI